MILHNDLLLTQNLIYIPNQIECTSVIPEPESAEYGAYLIKLNGFCILFRVAKITPTKIGQFVTLWKRIDKGPIQPYDISDDVNYLVICARKNNHLGQFIFPKSVLCSQNILSNHGKGGKRAIRIYPPWDKPTSKQALKTQKWQLEYFLEMPSDRAVDSIRVNKLYGILSSN